MGEDIDSLSLKELQSLEQQLEMALRRLRLKKNHLMFESISKLEKKIKGKEKELAEPPLVDQQTRENVASTQLNLGETHQAAGGYGEIEEPQRQSQPLTVIPYWMLQYISK
ncbi:agamous-like MADS-box protein AGL8 homolog isoform X2 [Bidens hawaiensis]